MNKDKMSNAIQYIYMAAFSDLFFLPGLIGEKV